jgi:hypothetical protein
MTIQLLYAPSAYYHHLYHSNTHLSIGHSTIEIIPTIEIDTIKEYRATAYSNTKSHTICLEPTDKPNVFIGTSSNKLITLDTDTKLLTIN